MTKQIKLSERHTAIVDDQDYIYLSQFEWKAKWQSTCYAYRLDENKRSISMHREIMQAPRHLQVDHINGNGLDNRRCNLRLCTNSENSRNQGKRSDNTSGYKGVSFAKNMKKFAAYIYLSRKTKLLGYYLTAEEAAHAYDEAAKKYYGEFAKTNF